jgi:predicted PurR-regulated permease PerM
MEHSINPRIANFTINLFLFCLIVFILVIAKSFLVPIAWALLISLSSLRFLERMHKKYRVKWGLLVLIHLVLVLFIILGVVIFLFAEVKAIIENSPEIDAKLIQIDQNLRMWLSGLGVNTHEMLNIKTLAKRLSDFSAYLVEFVGNVGHVFGDIFLSLIYSFFFLFYKDILTRFFVMKYRDRNKLQRIKGISDSSLAVISDYLFGTLLMTALMGIMIYVLLLVVGIRYALFWAVFAALLNLIPYIGNAIALVALAGYALLTKDSLWYPVLAVGILFLANTIQENILRPLIVGDKLSLNALTVFISVIAGGILWGVTGMIVFIPMAGIIKIILESREQTRPYSLFFGEPKPR